MTRVTAGSGPAASRAVNVPIVLVRDGVSPGAGRLVLVGPASVSLVREDPNLE